MSRRKPTEHEVRLARKHALTRRCQRKQRAGHWQPQPRYDARCSACDGSGLVWSVVGKSWSQCTACTAF